MKHYKITFECVETGEREELLCDAIDCDKIAIAIIKADVQKFRFNVSPIGRIINYLCRLRNKRRLFLLMDV